MPLCRQSKAVFPQKKRRITMLFYTDIIWISLLSGVVGAAIVLAFFLIRNKKNGGEASEGGKSKNVIVDGIRNSASDFAEMYEPVYAVSIGKNQKQEAIFEAWNQVVSASEDDDFKKAFADEFGGYAAWGVSKKGKTNEKKANKEYIKKASKLVKYFFKAGVVREHDTFVTADEFTAERYELVGEGIEAGATYDVLAPYWHLGDDIVDKGVIR